MGSRSRAVIGPPVPCPNCGASPVREGDDRCEACETAERCDAVAEALRDELRAARAEIERLKTAAADERADVVAAGKGVVERLHALDDYKESHAADTLAAFLSLVADGKHEGAHVGAAKGGER